MFYLVSTSFHCQDRTMPVDDFLNAKYDLGISVFNSHNIVLLTVNAHTHTHTHTHTRMYTHTPSLPALRKAKLVLAIILGQFLSLLLCGTGVTSQLLETNFSIAVPTTQAFLNYVLLAAVFGIALATRSDFLTVLWQNWWKYAILGAIDVEANFLIILAYKYTNLTSVQASVVTSIIQIPVSKVDYLCNICT